MNGLESKFKDLEIVDHRGRKARVIEVIAVFYAYEYCIEYFDSQEKVNYVFESELSKWTAGENKNTTCSHSNKYFNVLSASLKFWVCPDCKRDLGDNK